MNNRLDEIKEAVEDFRLAIAKKIIFEDCLDDEFIKWLDGRFNRTKHYLNTVYADLKRDSDHVEWGDALDHLVAIDEFRIGAGITQRDENMPENDKRIMILQSFLFYCCYWNGRLLKHIKVHVDNDAEEGNSKKEIAVRNALASINEAANSIKSAYYELYDAGITIKSFTSSPSCRKEEKENVVELYEGLSAVMDMLRIEPEQEHEYGTVTCGNITFKEKV